MKKIAFSILCAIMAAMSSLAGNISRFEYFGASNGLKQSSVYSIACDTDGFLWLGTQEGICRFDGKDFRRFALDAIGETTSSSRRVTKIMADKHRHLWLWTYDGQIRCFDQLTGETSALPEERDDVMAFAQYNDDIFIVATQKSGLHILRYDTSSHRYEKETLPNVRANALHIDNDGNLWATSSDKIILAPKGQMPHKGEVEPIIMEPKATLCGGICESRGKVIFGTNGRELILWNKVSNTQERMRLPQTTSGKVTLLSKVYGRGTVIGTQDAHLYFMTRQGDFKEIEYHGKGHDRAERAFVDHHDQVWITTRGKGVTRYDVASGQSRFYHLSPSHIEAVLDFERPVFYEDFNDELWIGLCGGGLLRYNRDEDKFESWLNDLKDSKSIPSNVVLCMTEDNMGNLWIGTGPYEGGLVKAIRTNKAFVGIKPQADAVTFGENTVRSLATDKLGRLWVGTRGGAIRAFDSHGRIIGEMAAIRLTDGTIRHATAYSLMASQDGRLWVATKGDGVFVSEKSICADNISVNDLRFVALSQVAHWKGARTPGVDLAYSLTEDGNGNIWVATYGGGIVRISGMGENITAEAFTSQSSGLADNRARYVARSRNGDILIGTLGGANVIRASETLKAAPSITPLGTTTDVCHIMETQEGNLCFSSIGQGLIVMSIDGQDTTLHTLTRQDGLCDNSVYGTAMDFHGDLWVITENGVNRIDRRRKTIESFNLTDGLPFCNFSEATILPQEDGTVIAGGRDGFLRISPKDILQTRHDETTMLTDLWVNGGHAHPEHNGILEQDIAYTRHVTLRHDQNNVTVRFATMDLSDPIRASFSYVLDGLETKWTNCGNFDYAMFCNLQPGDYALKIRHLTFDGRWSDDVKTLGLTILPPWWLSWWAKLTYLVALLCAVAIVIVVWHRVSLYRRLLLDMEDLVCAPPSLYTPQLKMYGEGMAANADDENEATKATEAKQAATANRDEAFISEMLKYAEDNYNQNLSIEQFAEHFNMSRTVFYNRVKALTGKGPLEVVRQVKFKIAANMLRKGYNVSEAAMEIGYSDVKYFSRLFKKIFGYTPSKEKSNG